MPGAYFRHLFGDTARALQERAGSRAVYARREAATDAERDALTERETGFLAARDSVYLASVTASGWPYLQHRGGPKGFVRALGGNRIGFADHRGNRQFISAGNVAEGGRASLFAMDYPARRRLKLVGHARFVARADDPDLVASLTGEEAPGAEAAFVVDVVGFDWNCPQFIEPRFTRDEIDGALTAHARELARENATLRAEVARLERAIATGETP